MAKKGEDAKETRLKKKFPKSGRRRETRGKYAWVEKKPGG